MMRIFINTGIRKIFAIITIATCAVVLMGNFNVAKSQTEGENIGIAVQPAIIELIADPGIPNKATLNIENTSSETLLIKIVPRTLIPIDNETDQYRRPEFDASAWISVANQEQPVEPKEVLSVDIDINVPRNANPGGHYASIAVRASSQTAGPLSGATVLPEISVSTLINVPGEVIESAEFLDSNVVSDRVEKSKETALSFGIRNTGNVHILPTPKIVVSNSEGVIETFTLQPQLILPNTEKFFQMDWLANVPYGNYKVQAELTYGTARNLISVEKDFKVWPANWQIAAAVVGLLGLIVVFIGRRNIARAFAVLGGSTSGAGSKYKKTPEITEITTEPQDVDYEAITEELKQEVSPILGFPTSQVEEKEEEIAEDIETEESSEDLDTVVEIKDQPPEEVEKTQKVPRQVEEFLSDDGGTKTVITQTGSTTIIREDSYNPTPENTISTKTSIKVTDAEDSIPKKKTVPKTKSGTKKTTKKSVSNKTKKKTTKTDKKPTSTKRKKTTTSKNISKSSAKKTPTSKKKASTSVKKTSAKNKKSTKKAKVSSTKKKAKSKASVTKKK
jgi:hypothetical protein